MTPARAETGAYAKAKQRLERLLPSRPTAPQGRATTELEYAAMREWTSQVAQALIGLVPTEVVAMARQAGTPLEEAAIDPKTGTRLGEMYGGALWTIFLDYEDGVVVRVATFQ